MSDDLELTPAQEVGMAMAHVRKGLEALERAAELGAVVLTRDSIQELVAKGDRALDRPAAIDPETHRLDPARVALTEIVETLKVELDGE